MEATESSRARIRASLRPLERAATGAADARHSDFDLNGPAVLPDRLKAAAVLVPLVAHAEGFTVLLTRRTEHLHHHAGQVSFPGGRVEDDDDGLLGAALREADEEIGLSPAHVEPAGLLDEYETVTRFLVTPVVAFVSPEHRLALDEFEVAEAFEMPLSFILDPRNHQIHSQIRNGHRRRYYAFEYGHHYVWGATAGMLMNFYRRLHGLSGPMRPMPGEVETRISDGG